MAIRNILQDNITTYLVNLLNAECENIAVAWKDYLSDKPNAAFGVKYKVYRDLQEILPYTPAVEVVARSKHNEIRMVGTQEDTFNFDIIITVNATHFELAGTYLRITADAIEQFLNDFQRRQFEIPNISNQCAYFSQAGDTDYGFRRGQGVRSAKIPWMCKVFKPERY
jgi:hypothetical protein